MKNVLISLLLVAASASAFAQAHKCKGPDGRMVYSDKPCAQGYSGGAIQLRENSIDTSMDWERQERYVRQRQAENEMQRRPTGGMAIVGTTPDTFSRRLSAQEERDCMVSAGTLLKAKETAMDPERKRRELENCLGRGGYSSTDSHSVRGYTRKDGTYVEPHRATNSDASKLNNWSTKGNINPYTGRRGTVDPY